MNSYDSSSPARRSADLVQQTSLNMYVTLHSGRIYSLVQVLMKGGRSGTDSRQSSRRSSSCLSSSSYQDMTVQSWPCLLPSATLILVCAAGEAGAGQRLTTTADIPDYAAHVAFELHAPEEGPAFVEVLYNSSPIVFPGCSAEQCPFDEFSRYVASLPAATRSPGRPPPTDTTAN